VNVPPAIVRTVPLNREKMAVIDPKKIATRDFHQFLLGAVAPRPIAFVSTIDEDGNPNLAPYSFFNAFSSNPPILVFSSNRRVVDNTTKDTLANVIATKEVVISVVNYDIVRQMTVASVQFDSDISEFEKAGLTPIPAHDVKPFLVKESPVNMECRVREIQPLGEHGGAGHLIICEVIKMHIKDEVIDENGRIDPHKIDLMGRLGRAFYVRASGDAIKTIVQPVTELTIGYSALPASIKNSKILSGNNIGQLAGLTEAPEKEEVMSLRENDYAVKEVLEEDNTIEALHKLAKVTLEDDRQRKYGAKIAWLGEYI
jgi:flavin reductase (DIM6/NTAB) family NADH-FMN oxidoreductase RutF